MKLLIIITLISTIDAGRILAIFPVPIKSHHVMSMTILEGLASRGHQIDLYTSFPERKPINGINHVEIKDINPYTTPLTVTQLREIPIRNMIKIMFEAPENGNDLCRKCFRTEIFEKLRKTREKYDILLVEMFVVDCFFAYGPVLGTPVVALTSSVDLPWGSYRIGNPDNPSFIPTYFSDYATDMTLFQRFLNAFTLIYAKYLHSRYLTEQEQLVKVFFNDSTISLDEIVRNTSLFLVNSHFSLNQVRPKIPNFIEIAGVHIKKPKNLTQEYLDFIGTSPFVYFSFGSIANSATINLDKLQLICDAFQKLGVKVIWKADLEQIPKQLKIPDNFLVKKWLPQLDLLCHPNISFFLTHSGLMSTQEAIYCAVPMLSVPIFADQFLNARNLELLDIGTRVDIENIDLDVILSKMADLIQNPKYKQNARTISQLFKDRPENSLDLATYWIEYVIRYKGAPHLRSNSANMSWYKYYLIDVFCVISLIVAIFLIVIYRITTLFTLKHYNNKKNV